MPRSNENTSLSHVRKPATTPSTPVLISTSVSTSTSSSSFYSSTSKDLSSTVPWYLPTPKMEDKLKKINESQKKRIIIILNVGRGGGKTAVGVSKDGISWRSETRDSVDTVYTYFLDRIRPIFKYVFDN